MFKNYLLIAIRNIKRHKAFSFINIAGFSISLAVVIVISLYAQMEFSTNKFHKNYDRIYKVGQARTSAPIADVIKLNIPEIKHVTRIDNFSSESVALKYGDNPMIVKNLIYADPDFFDIFSFPSVMGNLKTALNEPMSLVLTENEAKRIFGNQNPINKTVKMKNEFVLTVKAVVRTPPNNSSMHFSGVISFLSLKNIFSKNNDPYKWGTRNYETYFLLPPKYSIDLIKEKIETIIRQNIPEDQEDLNTSICSFKDIYYNSELSDFSTHGSVEKNFTLVFIAILILFISVINYINLSTARVSIRYKEVGIRKTIGATKFILIKQFLSESIILSVIAMIFGVLLASVSINIFNNLMDTQLSMFSDSAFKTGIILLASAIVLGTLAGLYPAFYLTSFKPDTILKGKILHGNGKTYLRKGLIIFQFSVTVVLIISTIVIYSQMEFVKTKPLGFQKQNIIYFRTNREITSKEDFFRYKILQQPAVEDFAYSVAVPGEMGMSWGQKIKYHGKEIDTWFTAAPTSADFMRMMKMKIVNGRKFFDDDKNDEYNVIVNEAFVKKYGLTDPLSVRITAFGENKGNVVGVVKDFNFQPLYSQVEPLVFFNIPEWHGYGLIKIASTKYVDIKSVINNLESVWKETSPDFPLEYFFLDEALNNQYKSEERFQKSFLYFSLLAILIACLGLYGLTAFTTEQRTKEFGIRKALGATLTNITMLVSRQFIVLVLISDVIALPVAYFFMNEWLQDFAYRIDITWWMLALSGGIALVIALATVSFQAIKAATANPVEALKYE